MSSQTGEKGVQKHASSRHRPYLQSLKAVEAHAAVLQQTLQQEQQRQQDIVEHNLVLSELAFTQGRLQAIHEKQQQWKLHGLDSADQVQGLLATSTAEPNNLQDAHWVVNLLETATPQQLQQELLMTCEDWTSYHRQYCLELTKLVEVDQRCPEVQVRNSRRHLCWPLAHDGNVVWSRWGAAGQQFLASTGKRCSAMLRRTDEQAGQQNTCQYIRLANNNRGPCMCGCCHAGYLAEWLASRPVSTGCASSLCQQATVTTSSAAICSTA